MKFTRAWLGDHLETKASLEEIAGKLTMLGLEVERVVDRAAALAPFTVGRVIEARRHPNADRLTVCRVDTGRGESQVVCGAPNARTGMKGVFAPVGAVIPESGEALQAATIRGVESRGMLCSEREMGLSDDHERIIELPEDATVGAPFAAVVGLDDPVVEVAVTANRGDCLGVRGIARELAAASLGTLKPFRAAPVEGAFESPVKWRRDLPAGQGHVCPMVVGRTFRGVVNGPSPKWIRDRLLAIGLRPISALVDITNYVTFDLGRPLHMFDADKLSGDLVMRLARPGETVLALDGGSYALEPDMVVIADPRAVHGIGGVMGGEASGCTESTVNAFLEVALFDPVRVASTGRRLGIESDARHRFERGVDPASALWGAEVAARLVRELCGGEASALTVAGEAAESGRRILRAPWRVRELGGADVPAAEQRRILDALGFETRLEDGRVQATVPSWRRDVEGEADLVEEVLRVWGFERVPPEPLRLETAMPERAVGLAQQRVATARRALAAHGMVEVVTWSFLDSRHAALFGGANTSLAVDNPISAELDAMRPSIVPNLIAAAARNADRGYPDVALFEVGPQYAGVRPEEQATVAAGLFAGASASRHWAEAARAVDSFDAKGAALAVLGACAAPLDKLKVTADAPEWYHP
ncbi:MAG: phenylalanine--tRNA ligase subunit beta, partial [Alphaproteobacteria bacterium]